MVYFDTIEYSIINMLPMIIVHIQKPSIYLQVSYIGQHLYKSGFYCTSTGKNLSFFVFSKKS